MYPLTYLPTSYNFTYLLQLAYHLPRILTMKRNKHVKAKVEHLLLVHSIGKDLVYDYESERFNF
jgi:hypothetical protein